MTQDISLLFKNKQWEKLASNYSESLLANSLSFKNGLRLAYHLLYNDKWDENLQEKAIKILNEIRKIYPGEWNSSWEYDALLGLACYITLRYDERYQAYKRAFENTNDPPSGLLIELARCCICSGNPPISYNQAIDLVKQALEEAPYADAIGLLSHIYSLKNDEKNEKYWTKVLEKSNKEFTSPSIEPKFLVSEYLEERRIK